MENLNTQIVDLLNAVRRSDTREVQRLLAAHISPTQCGPNGQTALMVAAQMGNAQIMRLLCMAAANRSTSAQIFLHSDATDSVAKRVVTNSSAITAPMANDVAAFSSTSPVSWPLSKPTSEPTSEPTVVPNHPALGCTISPIPSAFGLPVPTFAAPADNREPTSAPSPAATDLQPANLQPANLQPANLQPSESDSLELSPEALERAVRHNDFQSVNALLKAGVGFRPANWYDMPLLVIAAEKGYEDIVQALVDAGANVHIGYDQLPLHAAAAKGHLAVVQRLLNSGAYIHAETDSGRTALMEAAANGHFRVTELLMARGANVNATCRGETALMMAVKKRHRAVYELLYAYVSPAGRVPFSDSMADDFQLSLVRL